MKSITTAIGMGVSEKMGGIPALTIAAICITGITGAIPPSTSPSSMAFEVPSAWAPVPMASPFATGSSIRNSLQTASAS